MLVGRFSSRIWANARSASSIVDVAGQLLALLEDGVVEQLPDLLEGAVEVVPLEQLAPALGDPPGQVVEAGLVAAAPAEELPHRPLGRVARHHLLADRVQRLGQVDGRCERVRPAVVRPVAGADPSHRPSPRRRCPC